MKITNAAGDSFELKIVGYQYPEITDESDDANWLLIEVRVESEGGSWSATQPNLTTFEVEGLANWLKNIRKNDLESPVCAFIEPNLEFQIIENDAGKKYLRVFFELDHRPPWTSAEASGLQDVWMDFDLDSLDPTALANELRQELRNYPQRVYN